MISKSSDNYNFNNSSAHEIAEALSCGRPGCNCGQEISPGTWRTHCPAHDDENPSFDVTQKGDAILVHCKAGCPQNVSIGALKEKGLWPSRNDNRPQAPGGGGLTLEQFAKGKKLDPSFLAAHGVTQTRGKSGPYVVFSYQDTDGAPIEAATRFRFKMSERPKAKRGGKPAMYGLWRLQDFRPGGEIIICEGESDTLTFWRHDLPAVGLPGKGLTKTLDPAHFRWLSTVYVWQEPDAPEFPGNVAARLPGLTVKALVPPEGIKDISEAHVKGEDVPALVDQLKAAAQVVEPAKERQKGKVAPAKPDRITPDLGEISFQGLDPQDARRLITELGLKTAQVLLILAAPGEYFHDPHKAAYVSLAADGHTETMPVKSRDFKLWLRREYYRILQKAPGGQAVQDTLDVLEARALFDGPMLPAFVRLADHGGAVYLDLCNDAWQAVKITRQGWEIIANPPVKFVRRPGMLPLPLPERGGSIDELRPFLNLPPGEAGETAWRLIVSWLVMAFRPTGPYPILALHGPQGCAKSTAARMLRALIDPNSSPLRTEPREERDLIISARNSWAVCLDNLTRLPQWLSDGLCRLATGGGFAARTLYTNDEESLFEAMRPAVMTGINTVATSQDLADRQILVELAMIDDSARRIEADLWAAFEAARPLLLGALLDGVATALARLPNLKMSRLPRMADFAKWATAAEAAWGWPDGSFMAGYDHNRAGIVQASIESDPVSSAVVEFMRDRLTWEGTPSDLLAALKDVVPDDVLNLKHSKSYAFPQTANSLTRRIRKAAVFLAQSGITVTEGRDMYQRILTLIRQGNGNTVITVITVIGQENQQVTHDDIAGDTVMEQGNTVMPGNGGGIHDGISPAHDDMEGNTVMSNQLKLQGHDDNDDYDDKFPTLPNEGAV